MKRGLTRVGGSLGLTSLPVPLVPLAWGGWTSAMGSGLWFTIWALYLTERVGLTDGQTGIALSIAGLIGFVSPAPLGRLADRRGPRDVYAVLLAVQGIAVGGFLLCHTFAEIVLVASATAACSQGNTGVRAALIVQLAPGEGGVSALASLRACSHAGDAIGAGLGAIVIALNTGAAYGAAILLNAISYIAYAAAVARVPSIPPPPVSHERVASAALRDLPFVTLAAICGFLTLCWGLMSTGLPLWISGHTHAPRVTAGVIILISSVAIAGLQVRFSRRVNTPITAARTALRSGISLGVCCGLIAAAAGPGAVPATAVLLCAGVFHVAGELWFVAASWGLSVPLMAPERPAEYQGIFATGEALAIMLAPALMTTVIIPGGTIAWVALGVAFVLVGAAARPVTGWAIRTREPRRR